MIVHVFFIACGIAVGFFIGAVTVTREAMKEREHLERIRRRYGRC